MADLASSIPQLSFGQSDKETTVNELFDAASPALLFGRDGVSSQGLNFGLLGGRFFGAVVPNQVLALPDGETAYLSASAATGAVSVDVGDFAAGALPLYKVTTLGGLVTDYEDHRMTAQGAMGGIIDKQGKVLDDLIEVADYSASIDGLTTPGGYIVKLDSGVNGLISGATILVAENGGVVFQTLMATALSKIGTRYKDGVSWTEWVYCLAPNDVVNWHYTTTASAADAVINADGTFSREVSTLEFKRDVEPMEDSYADAIVQGVETIFYRSKCPRDPQDWGYWGIPAEQLAAIDPRFVHWGHSTKEVPQPFGPPKTVIDYDSPLKPIGVQYSRLVVPLLQVAKRQGAAIEALEARLAFLEMLHSP